MPKHSTFLTPELNDYLIDNFAAAEDDFLRKLNVDADGAGIPAISIAAEQTNFLQVLLRAINARRILEIGSLAGYSAISMARVLPEGGELIACEYEPMFADFIRAKAKEAKLDHVINVVTGAAADTIPTLSGPFDAVFIDADKPNYSLYAQLTLPLLRVGGLIIGDNALAWGQVANPDTNFEPHNVSAIRDFNAFLAAHPDVQSTLVPLGDGMCIGIKLR